MTPDPDDVMPLTPRTPYSLDLQRRVEALADDGRADWHDRKLPNGAAESWRCIPITEVIDAIEAADAARAPHDAPALDRERLAAALRDVDWMPFSSPESFDHLGYADAILAALGDVR